MPKGGSTPEMSERKESVLVQYTYSYSSIRLMGRYKICSQLINALRNTLQRSGVALNRDTKSVLIHQRVNCKST